MLTWMTRVNITFARGKIVPDVSLGCPVVQGGYFEGKIESLPKEARCHPLFIKFSLLLKFEYAFGCGF